MIRSKDGSGVPAPANWRDIPLNDRRAVVDGAMRGEMHPDPAVRRQVRAALSRTLSRWWNVIPGWVLPSVAVLEVVAVMVMFAATRDPVLLALAGLGVLAIAFGVIGWMQRSVFRRISDLYGPDEPGS